MASIEKLTAVMRMHRGKPRLPSNEQWASDELAKMVSGIENVRASGITSIHVPVLVGDHPEADKWDTVSALATAFKKFRGVQVRPYDGDPFYSVLQQPLRQLYRAGTSHILVVSHTSVHFLTIRVMDWVRRLFREGALCVTVVPPDMPTGIRGAANNQCTAWDLGALLHIGGFDRRDAKPGNFDMDSNIEGVGEAITALHLGPSSMGVIIPDVSRGDTRETHEQAKKRANKERRLNAWLERDGKTWEDLESLLMCDPINLRLLTSAT